jgi:N-acetylmuramoyl-L-alanine amidase
MARPQAGHPTAVFPADANEHVASSAEQQTALRVPVPATPQQKPDHRPGKRTIVIDPGHGGIDPGAIGDAGTYEKNVVLAMALELRRQLAATGRYEIVTTRDDDSFIRLRDRLQIARQSQGELFISLHADSLRQAQQVAGLAIYTLSERASNEEAARLAQKENRADILGGVDLSDQEDIVTQILIDLAQRDANNKSIRVAELMVDELGGVTTMLRRQRQQAGFVVLKSPDMPSVLIELGYLSNPREEQLLRDPAYLAKLATALVRAIDRYFAPAS